MDPIDPAARRMLSVSDAAEIVGLALVLVGAIADAPWRSIAVGAGCVVLGGDFIYTRRMPALFLDAAARHRVRLTVWHRRTFGILLVAGGIFVLSERLFR